MIYFNHDMQFLANLESLWNELITNNGILLIILLIHSSIHAVWIIMGKILGSLKDITLVCTLQKLFWLRSLG